jgi:hypothetical protein
VEASRHQTTRTSRFRKQRRSSSSYLGGGLP